MTENDNYEVTKRQHNTNKLPSTRQILGVTFGAFMVCIYLGMGVLMIINFFSWPESWAVARWLVGVVLIVYGFYRGWREYKRYAQPDDEE